jgi:hypothetical protein
LSFLAATSRGSRAACGREHRKRNGAIEKEVPNVEAALAWNWDGLVEVRIVLDVGIDKIDKLIPDACSIRRGARRVDLRPGARFLCQRHGRIAANCSSWWSLVFQI